MTIVTYRKLSGMTSFRRRVTSTRFAVSRRSLCSESNQGRVSLCPSSACCNCEEGRGEALMGASREREVRIANEPCKSYCEVDFRANIDAGRGESVMCHGEGHDQRTCMGRAGGEECRASSLNRARMTIGPQQDHAASRKNPNAEGKDGSSNHRKGRQ